MVDTLGDALPREIARVTKLIELYATIPTGVFAIAMMRQSLAHASKAMIEGDLVEMIRAYEDLKGFHE